MDDMTGGPNELTPEERALLRNLISKINHYEKQAIYKGGALKRIRDDRLYRQSHPGDFEGFCLDMWGKRKQTINRYIRAFEVTKDMEAAGLPSPPNVKAADLLWSLDPGVRAEVVAVLEDEGGLAKATAKRIQEVITSLEPPITSDVAERATSASVMVSRNGKVYRSTRVLAQILRELKALGEGADKIQAFGPYAVEDAIGAMSPQQRREAWEAMAKIGRLGKRFSDEWVARYGSQPDDGQQELPTAA